MEREVDLFEILARESLKLVRLIKVRSALPDRDLDELQDEIGDVVSRWVGYSMPLLNPRLSGSPDRIELVRASLICAPTRHQMGDRVAWALNDSSVLVVASPEDRATPTAGDAFVRDNERFVGFVLMHLATIGGLWSGIPVGSLELFERDASAAQSIWIPRVFVSGVLTTGLARRTAAQVLDDIVRSRGAVGSPGAQVSASDTAVIPSSSEAMYAGQLVGSAMRLDNEAFAFHEPDRENDPEREGITIGHQLALYFRFAAEKLVRIPRWLGLWFHDRIARDLSRNLQGETGLRLVDLVLDQRLDSRDQMLLLAARDVLLAETQQGTNDPRVARGPQLYATPRLWTSLRQMVFGALDGSSDPDSFGFEAIEGRAPVFSSVGAIAPDPDDVWHHPKGDRADGFPPAVDWRTARTRPELRAELVARVERALDAATKEEENLAAAVSGKEAARNLMDDIERQLIEAGSARINENGRLVKVRRSKSAPEPEGVPTIEQYRVAEAELIRAARAAADTESHIEVARSAVEVHERILADFVSWAEKHSTTFVWQLLDRLSASRVSAGNRLSESESHTVVVPDPSRLVELRKAFHRGILITISVVGALAAIFVAAPHLLRAASDVNSRWEPLVQVTQLVEGLVQDGRYPQWWIIVLCAAALILLLGSSFMIEYYRGWSSFERSVKVAEYSLRSRSQLLTDLRGEVRRLELLEAQTTEWLDALSQALYQPWSVDASWLSNDRRPLDPARLPLALHIARAVEGVGVGKDRLKNAAASALIRRGWRANAFSTLVREIGEELGLDGRRFGLDALDNDLPDSSNNSRSLLRQHQMNPEILRAVAEEHLSKLVEELQQESLYGAGIRVEAATLDPLADFRGTSDAESVSWSDFLTKSLGTNVDVPTPLSPLGIATHSVQNGHHVNVSSHVIAPHRIAVDLERSSPSISVRSYESGVAHSFDVVVRVDMVGPVPVGDVALWGSHPTNSRIVDDLQPEIARCPNCGRENCAGADPKAQDTCEHTGI